jgi:hypothetical protein
MVEMDSDGDGCTTGGVCSGANEEARGKVIAQGKTCIMSGDRFLSAAWTTAIMCSMLYLGIQLGKKTRLL